MLQLNLILRYIYIWMFNNIITIFKNVQQQSTKSFIKTLKKNIDGLIRFFEILKSGSVD